MSLRARYATDSNILLAIASLLCSFVTAGCGQIVYEPWVSYAEAAEQALEARNIPEADRNVDLMLKEADSIKYQGKEPPLSLSWQYKFLPSQGEIYYPDHLSNIADGYERAKHYDQAETFYRKALDIEMATCGNIPTTQIKARQLILFLDARGKKDEANQLRKKYLTTTPKNSTNH